MYALGIMGINLGIGLVNSYQAEFFDKILGANLMIVAAIILAAKIISIVADFVIGNLIDRANFKAGKMRPWILISAFPLAVFTMLSYIFIPFSSAVGRYIYITIIVILWNISMTLADIPSQGMLSLLSHDGDERSNAAGLANTLKSIALACPGVVITIVCMITGSADVGKTEYLVAAGLMAGLGLIFQLVMYFKTKEVVVSTSSSAMSFREMFHELRNNKMIVIVFLTFMLGFARNIGLGIAVQASTILLREGINVPIIGYCTGDKASWIIGITSALTSMVTIILNPVINRKLGEKRYFIIAGVYGFIVTFISTMLYIYAGDSFRTLWAILVYMFFLGFAYGPNGYLPMVMTSDIVDYQEWKTGKRTEGTQFAILSMSNKLSNALSVSIGILLVGAIGYSSNTYATYIVDGQISSNISTYITNGMQNKLWIIFFLSQGICMLMSCIPMLWYKIDDKTKKEMRAALAERRAIAAAENGVLEGEDGAAEVATDNLDAGDVLSQSEAEKEISEEESEEREIEKEADEVEEIVEKNKDDE